MNFAKGVEWYECLKDYVPGTNATVFSPAGGLRISCEELSHALSMLLNDGSYKGKQILTPASVKTMLGREWIYETNPPPSQPQPTYHKI